MKRFRLLILGLGIVFAGATAAAISSGSFEKYSKPVERYDRPSHGTHLCSDDSHCGTDHKCCSGHCKWVDTCG